ncbi:DUF4215 domain-containing protein [Nannocystis radixulma]|uniref:DUF4215 domain-containing protein n=1 Tax=Nannocystis radixulma TaxID=2995305 RepID=A0ABT5B1E1_9BACT|nr:DUF4215 domain-containing protein [Nannocystis radixulma]MDC0666876.1 DUF4215 domain-containing protein [Nannocystis radixulma]
MRPHDLSRPAALLLAGLCALTPLQEASAQTPPSGGTGGTGGASKFPPADAFTIQYWLTDDQGKFVRPMTDKYVKQYYNRARCECGHKIGLVIRLKKVGTGYDTTQFLNSFVGTQCATAETQLAGQFRRCAQFSSELVPVYQSGITTNFHPIWLTQGVSPNSTERLPELAITSGSCEANVVGQGGVWMCAPNMNTQNGCQADEFFIQGSQNINTTDKAGGIAFDFTPPLLEVTDFKAQPGDGAVVLTWSTATSGDIQGYRVLCEDAATGQPVPNKTQPRPGLLDLPSGTFFFSKNTICPNGPFSTFNQGEDNPLGTTSDGDGVDTDGTDTGGLDTGGDTGGDTGAETPNTQCNNGIVEVGEECDDGADNNLDTNACRSDCTRARCGDGSIQTDVEQCDDGNAVDNDGCTNACTTPTCGDGIVNGTDECDGGPEFNAIVNGPCTADCKISLQCGMMGGPACPQKCGDSVLDMGEGCDDGPALSDKAKCTTACQKADCGDGFVFSDEEECDDGNQVDDDGCTNLCTLPFCGDTLVQDGEECDDGMDNADNGTCLTNCREPTCGDGAVQDGVEECDDGVNNGGASACSEECTFNASQGMLELDWEYVCSGHLALGSKSVRINGLENGKEYNFMLVPYDLFGNPAPLKTIARGIPVATNDLWEQCDIDGGICGASGYCNVSDDDSNGLALFTALAALGLGGLGVANRRRNRA